jgi:hypothetical protein
MAKAGKRLKRKKPSEPAPPEPAPVRELRFKAPPELAEKLKRGLPPPELFRKLNAWAAGRAEEETKLAEARRVIDQAARESSRGGEKKPARQTRKNSRRIREAIEEIAAEIFPGGKPPETMSNKRALQLLGKALEKRPDISAPSVTTQLRAIGRRKDRKN